MIRRAVLLLAVFVAGSTAALAESGKAIDDVDAADFRFGAMAIGQAKDLDYARAEGLGLVPASPLNKYLDGILAKLLAQSPVRNVPARVHVRAGGDFAAKTTADANIYVALGTLLRLDDEDEVAALLAHEAAHVLLAHADADVVQDVQQRAIQLSSLAFETKALIEGGGSADKAAKKSGEQARVQEQSRALLLNTTLIAPAWTREQERDADLLGTDLLVRAGYAPRAMVSLLRKQQSFENQRAANPQARSLDQQLAPFGIDVHKETGKQAAKVAKSAGVDDQGLGALAGVALGKALEWGSEQVAEVQRSHPKTEERIGATESYITREHVAAAAKAPQAASWEAAKEADGTVEILENYIAAIEANAKLGDGDLAAARKLAKAGLSGATRAHAYPNYVEAAVQIAGGNSAPALTAYEAALAGPELAGSIYTEASRLYLETGKRDKAVGVIEAGYSRLQEAPSLTVPLIRTYRVLGRQADADRIAAQCGLRWPKMQSFCADAAKGS